MSNRIQYTIFSDDPNGTTLRETDSIGDLMDVGQFFEDCVRKNLMDYDGSGYFVKEVNGVTTYKYTKTSKLFEALMDFYK